MRSAEEKQCEDFWEKWKEDPVGLSEICGYALAKTPLYYEHFLCTFGETLFRNNQVCDRIDFLYKDPHRKPPQHSEGFFNSSIDWGIHEDTIKITDKEGTYDSLTIYAWSLLLSNPYSIRTKVGHDWLRWSFVGGDEFALSFASGGKSDGQKEGFLDIRTTKMVVNLLVWTTNVLGYKP